MAEAFHKSLGGRITMLEWTRDELEHALKRAPWEWSVSPRGFEPWPAARLRGVEVSLPSLADTTAAGAWKRAGT